MSEIQSALRRNNPIKSPALLWPIPCVEAAQPIEVRHRVRGRTKEKPMKSFHRPCSPFLVVAAIVAQACGAPDNEATATQQTAASSGGPVGQASSASTLLSSRAPLSSSVSSPQPSGTWVRASSSTAEGSSGASSVGASSSGAPSLVSARRLHHRASVAWAGCRVKWPATSEMKIRQALFLEAG